jgi:hypothetical protein
MLFKYRLTEDGQIFTDEDFQYLLSVFFSHDPEIMGAVLNDEMVTLLWRAVTQSRSASKAIGFVPKPAGTLPGASYVAKTFLNVAREMRKDIGQRRKIEVMVQNTVTWTLRTDMRLAAISGGSQCDN